MKRFHARKGGFTLIELMIVVAIIGILAAIAIPNFIRFQLKAKSSEGKTNLAAIRTAEESYFSEFGTYVSAAASPNIAPDSMKQTFVDEGACPDCFDRIGWAPEGTVFFNYAVGVGNSGADYLASAEADIDNDDDEQLWGYSKGTVDGQAHAGGETCTDANATNEQVGPCKANSGQSVF